MSIARLRRIVNSELVVHVESSAALLNRVQGCVDKRIEKCTNKGVAAPDFKPFTTLPQHDGSRWSLTPAKLLHKLGRLTIPRGLGNMARLSASWATRRYFWAIAEATAGNNNFRLSDDAVGLDFHQKGLLSDEFGVGMAGLFMEEKFGAAEAMDVSLALGDEELAAQIEQVGETQPDYLMWEGRPDGTRQYYVVECKGTLTHRGVATDQIRRGLEQLPSIEFADADRHLGSYVIATLLGRKKTRLLVVDPPDDDKPRRRFVGGKGSERREPKKWVVTDVQEFERRTHVAAASQLLQWAGQNRAAVSFRREIEEVVPPEEVIDLPTTEEEVEGETYVGTRVPLFPELSRSLFAFLGVSGDLLETARQDPVQAARVAVGRRRLRPGRPVDAPRSESVSLDGTCLRIEGLE